MFAGGWFERAIRTNTTLASHPQQRREYQGGIELVDTLVFGNPCAGVEHQMRAGHAAVPSLAHTADPGVHVSLPAAFQERICVLRLKCAKLCSGLLES